MHPPISSAFLFGGKPRYVPSKGKSLEQTSSIRPDLIAEQVRLIMKTNPCSRERHVESEYLVCEVVREY